MAVWRVEEEGTFDTPPGEPTYLGTDTSGGHWYRLVHLETGEEREFRILFSSGPSDVTFAHVRDCLQRWLDHPDPRPYVTLDRHGTEIPSG